jgi:hypothetical protein
MLQEKPGQGPKTDEKIIISKLCALFDLKHFLTAFKFSGAAGIAQWFNILSKVANPIAKLIWAWNIVLN